MQILTGILLSFSAYAWNLPVGDFEFEAVVDKVYVMHGPLTQPNEQNRGFMNNPAVIVGKTGLILIDPQLVTGWRQGSRRGGKNFR